MECTGGGDIVQDSGLEVKGQPGAKVVSDQARWWSATDNKSGHSLLTPVTLLEACLGKRDLEELCSIYGDLLDLLNPLL